MNTSVTAEDLFVHYGSNGQAVEAVGECLPQLDVESAFTCKINKTVSQSIHAYKIQHTVDLTSDSQHFWLGNPSNKTPVAPCRVSYVWVVSEQTRPLKLSDGFISKRSNSRFETILLAHQARAATVSRLIPKIKSVTGDVVSDPAEVNRTFYSFYSKLHTSQCSPEVQDGDNPSDKITFPNTADELGPGLGFHLHFHHRSTGGNQVPAERQDSLYCWIL